MTLPTSQWEKDLFFSPQTLTPRQRPTKTFSPSPTREKCTAYTIPNYPRD